MNPHISKLPPYPFEKLIRLKQGIQAPADKAHIALSIGEPQHATPHFIQETLLTHLHSLVKYPTSKGLPELRSAIGEWIAARFQIPSTAIDPETQVLPVSGTREALFSFAQAIIDPREKPIVIMPNPFYQIYEGAALLAGAEPYYLHTLEENNYAADYDAVPESVWQRCQLLYICSPGNPTGAVISRETHAKLIALAEKYDFVIASDECYSEIYNDEQYPPPGLLETAHTIGNTTFKRCVIFQSLSKRSNAPGLRSGFVAGDAGLLQQYYRYRTYHGCAMPLPIQHASIRAWQDEQHVIRNRRLYREKFSAVLDILAPVCAVAQPPASFYIWLKTPVSDTEFTRQLYAQQNITVLPGSYLSRTSGGIDPGENHVRIALVAPQQECAEAADRLKNFIHSL